MASATYRVIQDSAELGVFTRAQVDEAVRSVMQALAKKRTPMKKSGAAAKRRRASH